MKRAILSRTMVEGVVDQGIRTIRKNPKPSVRKLVDLGEDLDTGPLPIKIATDAGYEFPFVFYFFKG